MESVRPVCAPRVCAPCEHPQRAPPTCTRRGAQHPLETPKPEEQLQTGGRIMGNCILVVSVSPRSVSPVISHAAGHGAACGALGGVRARPPRGLRPRFEAGRKLGLPCVVGQSRGARGVTRRRRPLPTACPSLINRSLDPHRGCVRIHWCQRGGERRLIAGDTSSDAVGHGDIPA